MHEFWSERTLGVRHGSFEAGALDAMGLSSYAIREKLDRPQLISTSRHLSQGAAEIEALSWDGKTLTLTGRSRIVAADRYVVTLRIPSGYTVKSASVDRKPAELPEVSGEYARFTVVRPVTGSAEWSVSFDRR